MSSMIAGFDTRPARAWVESYEGRCSSVAFGPRRPAALPRDSRTAPANPMIRVKVALRLIRGRRTRIRARNEPGSSVNPAIPAAPNKSADVPQSVLPPNLRPCDQILMIQPLACPHCPRASNEPKIDDTCTLYPTQLIIGLKISRRASERPSS